MRQDKENQPSDSSIWVIGNSMLIDGVATCLEDRKVKNLVRYEELNIDVDDYLQTRKPSLIIFELDTPDSYMFLEMLKGQPGTQLLGIDKNSNRIIVLNSYQRQTRTMADLYQIIVEVTGKGE